ncbi:glycosyl hydrolase [Flavitalea sp. BT771]|uniref:glycosyl hydrolase n=1 Tax=Flavitalea sp. BT771 TaxID=3063329 RepID=UPI0026E3C6D5|nr:glycosyl hydrolase [Flavitalea sp. BT771]MDO6429929.1 glycosyl hydrolase [Flavitalea sp. BT771]MDV6217943.1 glycosyl hydrolase [Flavitalea sp. BT771]
MSVTPARSQERTVHWARISEGFQMPPDSVQTSIYWYWISGNISKEGVVKDLEAMKKAGIGRAFIGNVGLEEMPDGKVRLLSPEWWEILHTALKTASQLHIDIGMFNSPGWSGTGGPWVTPGHAMRRLVASETYVKGAQLVRLALPMPADSCEDVRVIAYPRPREYNSNIFSLHPSLSAEPSVDGLSFLLDGREDTEFRLPDGNELAVTLHTETSFTARSLIITPGLRRMKLEGEIQVEENGVFRKLSDLNMDRSNDALNTGFDPYGPLAVSFPAAAGRSFRIIFRHWSKDCGIRELKLSADPVVANYIEKTLAKMYPTPLPYWKEYQWPVQPEVTDPGLVIDGGKVMDISSSMDVKGYLSWNAPPGDWVVLRTGMTPTRVVNSPAQPEGRGLQGDKMSKQHVAENFDAFLGEILRRIPAADRTCFKVVVEDSYEVGGQNWTDGMIASFKARYGYDPLPYIPAMLGKVVGSEDQSDRFLWDLRRFIADKVAYDYVGGLREVSHRHGLTTWLENYGHWGFPGEFLQYGGQSDEVSGEFWSEGELGNIENRAASSSAHIYGKNKVSAESFTSGGRPYVRYPAMLKPRGDRFFTEGINNTLLHVFISQQDQRVPGTNAWFGTEFNRHNTWFSQLDVFISYLRRCNFMLRQGRYVADVAYFIGEDAPKMTGVRDPELPGGYSYDYINAEVIEQRLSVKDGRWTLPDGLSYRILVLPKLATMRPALLQRIYDLVSQGGVLLGPAPERSPSLEDYGNADRAVRKLAGLLWGDGAARTHAVGKGLVMNGFTMEEALALLKLPPDVGTKPADSLLFLHRTTSSGEDIYFVSNQSAKQVSAAPVFRVQGKVPMLFDPLLGSVRDLPVYTQEGEVTKVPLELEKYQSFFVVFRKGSAGNHGKANFPAPLKATEVRGPWTVYFDTASRGPAAPVVFPQLTDWAVDPRDSIRYYSGRAIYRNSFSLPTLLPGRTLYLDLGMVVAMAKVKVNGVYVGGAWTPPYKVDITRAAKAGTNTLEIEVVNTWVNRIIGDSRSPVNERRTWSNVNPYTPESTCFSAGLLGPVKVLIMAQ